MKVYVLEMGRYADREIIGVYATPELAMAACEELLRSFGPAYQENDGRGRGPISMMKWTRRGSSAWLNDGDMEDAARVDEYHVFEGEPEEKG